MSRATASRITARRRGGAGAGLVPTFVLTLGPALALCASCSGEPGSAEPAGATSEGAAPQGAPAASDAGSPTVGAVDVLTDSGGGVHLQRTHDFGAVRPGEPVTPHVFSFVWNGDEPLLTQALRPSCACLSAVIVAPEGDAAEGSIVELAPGASIPPGRPFGVRVTLDPEGLSGSLRKVALLTTAEPPGALRLVVLAEAP